jgi:hypothetical protein
LLFIASCKSRLLGEDDLESPVIDFVSHCKRSSKFADALCRLAVRLVDPSAELWTSLVVDHFSGEMHNLDDC